MSMTSTGENSIVIVGGANQAFDTDLPQEWVDSINDADVLLMQREIPESVNIAAARVAKSGAKIQ
jgi:ribokinase